MRKKVTYAVIAFDQTEGATQMEQYCHAHDIPGRIIPLPPAIDAGCGLAWRMSTKDFASCQTVIMELPHIKTAKEVQLYES